MAAQNLIDSFRPRTHNEINCLEITDLNLRGKMQISKILKFFIKGGPIGCLRLSVRYARAAFDDINTSLSQTPVEVLAPPVSCAALLAQKSGAADIHTVMVAGFAGGIGLSGGACGALAAAVWLNGIDNSGGKVGYKVANARAGEIINKFLKVSDFKFECSEIVGRKFESVADHAAYLRGGGCANLIEHLAAK